VAAAVTTANPRLVSLRLVTLLRLVSLLVDLEDDHVHAVDNHKIWVESEFIDLWGMGRV
jgi:hypothetical protein